MENGNEMKLSFQNSFKIKHGILNQRRNTQHSKDNKRADAPLSCQEDTPHVAPDRGATGSQHGDATDTE